MKLNQLNNLLAEKYGDPVNFENAMSALSTTIKYIGGKLARYVANDRPHEQKYVIQHRETVELLQSIYDAMSGGTEEDMRKANSVVEMSRPTRSWEPMGAYANIPTDTLRYLEQFG